METIGSLFEKVTARTPGKAFFIFKNKGIVYEDFLSFHASGWGSIYPLCRCADQESVEIDPKTRQRANSMTEGNGVEWICPALKSAS